jgi:hypothetical protein
MCLKKCPPCEEVLSRNWGPSAKWRNEMHFRVFLYITNCAQIILKEWYMFRGNLTKTQGDMRELVSATKKFPKQKIFIHAFSSEISCKYLRTLTGYIQTLSPRSRFFKREMTELWFNVGNIIVHSLFWSIVWSCFKLCLGFFPHFATFSTHE